MNAKVVQRLRKGTQIISFALFMFLFIQAVYLGQSALASDLYYRLDPLTAATAMIAGRAFIAGLLYSLINLLAAVIFGRVWCGWLCPMGTMLDWFSPRESSLNKKVRRCAGQSISRNHRSDFDPHAHNDHCYMAGIALYGAWG